MTRLVQDLLCLARADAQQHLELAPADIAPLIQAACRTARGLSETVRVELGDVPEGCVILANAERFIELLAILLDNAIRYSPPFEHVEVRARRLRRGTAAGVLVEIADHGPGIPVEERERIFERFYRSRTAGYRDGVGLGLAVARWIATEHHAELTVMDNTPVGSVFCLWLASVGGAEPSGRDRS